jgi:hypothetical protein
MNDSTSLTGSPPTAGADPGNCVGVGVGVGAKLGEGSRDRLRYPAVPRQSPGGGSRVFCIIEADGFSVLLKRLNHFPN